MWSRSLPYTATSTPEMRPMYSPASYPNAGGMSLRSIGYLGADVETIVPPPQSLT
jgi:hypothetical protein